MIRTRPDVPPEVWDLIAGACEGSLSIAEQHDLESRLLGHPQRQRALLDYCGMHADLFLTVGVGRAVESVRAVITSTSPHARRVRLVEQLPPLAEMDLLEAALKASRQAATLVSDAVQTRSDGKKSVASPVLGFLGNVTAHAAIQPLVLVLLVAAAFLGHWFWPREPKSFALGKESGVAILTAVKDCQWNAANPKLGSSLVAGKWQLLTGVVEIEFTRGTRLLIEGPSDFELQSAGQMFLGRGKVFAEVPRQAIGFTVETPCAKVVDQGTEFAVDVTDNQQVKLAVAKGVVELLVGQAPPLRLIAGKAAIVARHGNGEPKAERVDFDPMLVDRAAQLRDSLSRMSAGIVAFQASPDGAAGNVGSYRGGLGLDFDVIRPIRINSLGVFDHLGDGINADSRLTVQLWLRNDQGTPADPADDTGVKPLAELVFAANDSGPLEFCHRFKSLAQSLELAPGAYSIVAYGCSQNNSFVDLGLETLVASRIVQADGAIVPIGSRFQEGSAAGVFPKFSKSSGEQAVSYIAGSIKFQIP